MYSTMACAKTSLNWRRRLPLTMPTVVVIVWMAISTILMQTPKTTMTLAWTTTVASINPTTRIPMMPPKRQQQQQRRHRSSPLHAADTASVVDTDAADSSDATTTTSNQDKDILSQITLFSPCKINLFLRILRKRNDGYHDLASLFQAIGFGDTLEMKTILPTGNDNGDDETTITTAAIKADTFTCNMDGVPTDSTNLVLRAIQLMREKTGRHDVYFDVNLFKQCPAQAGLGGGSANAATAMWGTNELLGRPASLAQMVEWSAALGSDITFFLSRGTAYCTGRGEIMTETERPLAAGTKVVIVKPSLIGLSTPTVFKALDYEQLSLLDADTTLLPAFLQAADDVKAVPDEYFVNDLEHAAFSCVPELQTLKDDLSKVDGFDHVLMSGSGTSIYCLGHPVDMDAFEEKFVSRDDLQVFFSEFINRPDGAWFERP